MTHSSFTSCEIIGIKQTDTAQGQMIRFARSPYHDLSLLVYLKNYSCKYFSLIYY